jgi:hypothetical protein
MSAECVVAPEVLFHFFRELAAWEHEGDAGVRRPVPGSRQWKRVVILDLEATRVKTELLAALAQALQAPTEFSPNAYQVRPRVHV